MVWYFSGTGNTRYCAERLSKLLSTDTVAFDDLWQNKKTLPECAEDDAVVMFPVYAWGMPPVVENTLHDIAPVLARSRRVWLVMTCGDDCGLTAKAFRKLMSRYGIEVAGAFSLQMPNTYVCMKGFDVDSTQTEDVKVAETDSRIALIADLIKGARPVADRVTEGSFAWVKSHILRAWFLRYKMSPKPLHHNDRCTACGLCIRTCPMQNISRDAQQKPVWNDKCAMCLRCYHICPQHAVQYGKITSAKGQSRKFVTKYIKQ